MTNSSVARAEAENKTPEPNMLAWALAYARRVFYVFPVHTPLHNHPQGYLCSCEEYRHTEKCRQADAQRRHKLHLDPDQHCRQPGKCPRVRWRDKSTIDEVQIRKWWTHWPSANIGCDMGKSGLLALDADLYKEAFAADLSQFDQRTLTNLTGRGGQHLIYRQPEGAHYGNETGDLPEGIDIRGEGGYIILPPSLHACGRRYQWEADYGPGEIEAAEMPAALRARLDAAVQGKARRKAATISLATVEVGEEAPDLAQWRIPSSTAETIRNGHAAGTDRSKADMRVITVLCYAGLTDEQIYAVFQHYPIGTAGKYAERGLDYLERTIGNARAYVEAHPPKAPPELPPDPTIPLEALLARAEEWVLTGECAAQLRAAGFKRIEGPRKTLGGLIKAARLFGSLRVSPGVRGLAELAGVGHSSLADHLQRLADAGLIELAPGEGPHVIRLTFAARYPDSDSHSLIVCPDSARQLFYHDHLADEAFIPYPYTFAIKRRAIPTVLADSLSAGALVAWQALLEHGELTRSELSEETGISLASAGHAMRRLELGGFASSFQESRRSPKVYKLKPNAEQRLDEVRPEMKSFGVGALRARRRALASSSWADRQLRLTDDRDRRQLMHLRRRRDQADVQALEWAHVLEDAGIDPTRRVGASRPQRKRMRYDARELSAIWYSMGDTAAQRTERMLVAGWDEVEVHVAAQAARRYADPAIMAEIVGDSDRTQMPTIRFEPPEQAAMTAERFA